MLRLPRLGSTVLARVPNGRVVRLRPRQTSVAQFIIICSASKLAEALGILAISELISCKEVSLIDAYAHMGTNFDLLQTPGAG